MPGPLLYPVGALAGFLIGVVAALLGVAGGELLIPTITLLYHLDVKLAGSMSLLVSLTTMLFAFARYSRDRSFLVLREKVRFMLFMVFDSLLGSFLGGSLLLKVIPQEGILMLLVLILLISSYKLLKH
nr:TSUP family transporter [Hydrogenobacter thermophilus]